MKRSSSTLAKLLAALVATLIAVAAGELIVRGSGAAPEVKPIWVSDEAFAYQRSQNPVLSFELKPDYRNDSPDLFQSYESTNSHGQRDVERSIERAAGVRRVLLVGDSVVEVLNFGVSGYCTRAEVELLESKGLEFDPDDVVLLFVENDFNNFNAEAFQLGEVGSRPVIVKRLFLVSHAFRLAALRFNLWGFAAEQDPMRWNRDAVGDNNVVEGLIRFRDLARVHGFNPLVAIWPRFDDSEIVDLPAMPGDPGSLVVERLTASLGLPSLRLSDAYRRSLAGEEGSNPRLAYTIGDGMHPSVAGCAVAASALVEALGDAEREVGEGTPDEATVEAALALGQAAEPNYARVFTRLGNLAREEGRSQEAEKQYLRALEEDPGSTDALINLGNLKRDAGDDATAEDLWRRALQLDPGRGDARFNVATMLHEQGRVEQAEAEYRRLLLDGPSAAEVHNNLGRLLEESERWDDAIREYTLAVELDGGLVQAWINLGIALASRGRLDDARIALSSAIERDPDRVGARINLAEVLARQGNGQAAAAELLSAHELAQSSGNVDLAERIEQRLARLERRAGGGGR